MTVRIKHGTKLSYHVYLQLMSAFILLPGIMLFSPLVAYADTPLEQLRENVGKITGLLDNQEYRETHSKEELKKKLIEVSQDSFDWEEIARRSLGLYWKDRSPVEKEEFTVLLKDLLINTYLDKIVDNYSGESVLFDKEIIKGKRAFIDLRIINKAQTAISLGARMVEKKGRWLVYDLIIEGVSSVKNYRVQFYDIIRQFSYSELLQKLKTKVNDPAAEKKPG